MTYELVFKLLNIERPTSNIEHRIMMTLCFIYCMPSGSRWKHNLKWPRSFQI